MTTTSALKEALFEAIAEDVREARIGQAMAKLAAWVTLLGSDVAHDDGVMRPHFAACAQAASRFAEEWGALVEIIGARMRATMASPAAWIACPAGCPVPFCALHGEHVTTCGCPPQEEWTVDPFEAGGPGECPGSVN